MGYLTDAEMQMDREEVNLQVALGLKSCETLNDVCELLNEIRKHEVKMQKEGR